MVIVMSVSRCVKVVKINVRTKMLKIVSRNVPKIASLDKMIHIVSNVGTIARRVMVSTIFYRNGSISIPFFHNITSLLSDYSKFTLS